MYPGVNMRNKKTGDGGEGEESRDGMERPMSWEGELSDNEEMPTIKQVSYVDLL